MGMKMVAIAVVVVSLVTGIAGLYFASGITVVSTPVENKTGVTVTQWAPTYPSKVYITPVSYSTLESDLKEVSPFVVEVASIPAQTSQVVSYSDFIKSSTGNLIQMVKTRKEVVVTNGFFPIDEPTDITEIWGRIIFTAKGYTYFLVDGKYLSASVATPYNTSVIVTWSYPLGEHTVSAQKLSKDGKVVLSEINKKVTFVDAPKEVRIGSGGAIYWHNGLKTFNYTDTITLYCPTTGLIYKTQFTGTYQSTK